MSTQVQYRRGTGAQNDAFTGALAEITVDTTDWTLRVHDGVTAGGTALVSTAGTQTLTNKTLTAVTLSGTATGTANINITGFVTATGNVTGGNLITAGLVSLSSITKTGSNGVGNIGSSSSVFDTVFAKATSAQYADVAERYLADADYPTGTVLVFGGDQEVTQSQIDHSTAIAGTVSDRPAYVMNTGLEGDHVVSVALLGRVPVRVIGTIRPGDLLVASELPGIATSLVRDRYAPGCVIGKALGSYDGQREGVIEAVVGRL